MWATCPRSLRPAAPKKCFPTGKRSATPERLPQQQATLDSGTILEDKCVCPSPEHTFSIAQSLIQCARQMGRIQTIPVVNFVIGQVARERKIPPPPPPLVSLLLPTCLQHDSFQARAREMRAGPLPQPPPSLREGAKRCFSVPSSGRNRKTPQNSLPFPCKAGDGAGGWGFLCYV